MGRFRRRIRIIALLLATGLPGLGFADELRGVALVIGAADYETLNDLGNPLNDARAMDDLLSDMGFDVTRVLDRGAERMRREIDDFIADAKGADVAMVYYAGHAVEVAGQNYLVPVDADISTPALAGESLVAVAPILDALARTVPVTIALLDACRTEIFPEGFAVLLPGADVPVATSAVGLGEMRGPTPVVANVAPENLGMVIGFAASPGQPALDGPPGTNSPYAAALLKHLGAGNFSFGDLMTLVSEEVYLKTGAKQVPWVNSSLRRVLSFEAVEEAGDDEALIRDGRRKLLLSIAAMPGDVKRQVENAAAGADVPMDALYGLLDALGAEAPRDPAELDTLLRRQTETVRTMMEERQALSSTDSEIVRLSGLAQQAFDEGALAVSIGFLEQAKTRYATLSASLDVTEDLLKARRLEGGELLARTATAYMLSGDHALAAENYRLAFEEVVRWDDERALAYRISEADATYEIGVLRGDNAALRAAADLYDDALARTAPNTIDWGLLQRSIGTIHAQLGLREISDEHLIAAIDAFNAALTALPRETAPREWAITQASLGPVLAARSEREPGTASVDAAIAAYTGALEVLSPVDDPDDWSMAQQNLANSLRLLGTRSAENTYFEASIVAFRAAVAARSREDSPYDWAVSQTNLGAALMQLGMRTGDRDLFVESIATIELAIAELPRERVPDRWARAYSNIGVAQMWLGADEAGPERLQQAIASFTTALEEFTPEDSLSDWAIAMTNLGNAFTHLGKRGDRDSLARSVDIYRTVSATLPREQSPAAWADAQNNLGVVLNLLGEADNNPQWFMQSAVAIKGALTMNTRERSPLQWAQGQENLGNALTNLAASEEGPRSLLAAAAAYEAASQEYTLERSPRRWAILQRRIGHNLFDAGMREENGVGHWDAALKAYDGAMSVLTLDSEPVEWAITANSAGWAMAQRGYALGDAAGMLEGRGMIQQAWDIFRANGISEQDEYFAGRISLIDGVLAEWTPPL